MAFTVVLAAFVGFCLLYGRLPAAAAAVLCCALAAALGLLGRHSHDGAGSIDALAQHSRLCRWNPGLKCALCLGLMVICLLPSSPWMGAATALGCLALTVWGGGVPLHDYLRLMALPAVFLLLGALALLFEYSQAPGVLNLPLAGGYLCVTRAAQDRALLVLFRALGAVSCLYLLSLSTPMHELIGVLRRTRCPGVVITLMYLIYRYIFILLAMYRTMRDAAASRLGYARRRAALRTTGQVFGSLMARSYRQANRCFDAMESRCFDGSVRFLQAARPLTAGHPPAAAALTAAAGALALALR